MIEQIEPRSNLTPANTIKAKLTGDAICTAEGHTGSRLAGR
jgi:hypothetical protein